MSSFFKKALGVFVEFDEETKNVNPQVILQPQIAKNEPFITPKSSLNNGEIEKFEQHFDQLFNKANLPGPDYFEFWKMMETLEVHIPDEKSRISAVFASLSIQGLSKEKLLESASHYKTIIEKDKNEFENAVADKSKIEIDSRNKTITDLEKKMAENVALVQNLNKEIADAQGKMTTLKSEITEAEQKIINNKGNYNLACDAMLNKLSQDIIKIQSTI